MAERIELEPDAIARLIRSARLEDLRIETTEAERERSLGQAITALDDALWSAPTATGTDEVWDVLAGLDRRRAADVRDVRDLRARREDLVQRVTRLTCN